MSATSSIRNVSLTRRESLFRLFYAVRRRACQHSSDLIENFLGDARMALAHPHMNTFSPTQRRFICTCLFICSVLCGCEKADTAKGAAESYPDQHLKGPNNGRSNTGVVLAYRKDVLPEADEPTQISVDQTIVVRVRNLDGWLIDKLRDNRITGEPDMTSDQRKNFVLLLDLKGEEGSESFLRRYEAAAAIPSPSPAGSPGA